MLASASDSARLNSRRPLPTAFPASGSRLAPKTSSTMSIRMTISPAPRLPNITSPALLREPFGPFLGRRRFDRIVLEATLEFFDALPDRRPDLGDPLRAEEEHQDEQQDRNFREAEIPEHGLPRLEERPGDEVGDDDTHHREQRNVQSDRSQRYRHHEQIQMDRPDGRRHGPREHFPSGSLRQKAPQERMQQPAHYEAYSKNANIEEGATRAVRHGLAAPFHGIGEAPLQGIPPRGR